MEIFDVLDELDHPVAVVVTDAERVLARHGETAEPLRWASVTKLISTMASLVAVQRGMVGLDDPAGPPGATVRHLLAHAAGVPFDDGAVLSEPGRRRVYSNRGIELLAEHVAEHVGTDFTTWAEQTVLEPLGMATVLIDGSPAHGAAGSADDLARLGRELLSPTLLGPELFAEATHVVFPGLSGVLPGYGRQKTNDWGLGFEIRDHKTPHWTGESSSPATFGHFGQSGSFLWVDPEAGLATAFLSSRPFGDWAVRVWPPLTDAILAEHAR
ncbi:serine hydrolase domain-containing protein [Georgenia muralis]|uniref:CubicO group peptidase (Beta-lactamase class C family) n=1 Tax=Georgenia muralis TaxID=154117 RepID=A0A3N4Z7N4_9MICO|nr:serine hydrolase domain-containing protein [Georgenia muralis]RPF27210.1 CubicO group peptidase (beta-lactamase class C family) [Georgenia muralis]